MSHAAEAVVVVYAPGQRDAARSHEAASRMAIARQLAAFKGMRFAGQYDPARHYPGPVYFVPRDTLCAETAAALGIRGEDDLFGGVVPDPLVATKAITHPLVAPDADAPSGWSHAFGDRVRDVVLFGFTAFSLEDAWRAGTLLLTRGPARLKPVRATGGRGQTVISTPAELQAALAAAAPGGLTDGLVIEEDLADVTTYSVGQVRVAGLVATYCGTQSLTTDHHSAAVYGGSDLLVVRGGFDTLLGFALPEPARLAAAQALAYDAAAMGCFAGLLASRRNYDIAQGFDAEGQWRSGVLEQSWRIGGASGAEIAALEAFRDDPGLEAVRASTVEVYGECEPPPHATVYFCGSDERVGRITKYTVLELHEHAR